jgi:hypothetical protein
MEICKFAISPYLTHPIQIHIKDESLDFYDIKEIAKEKAKEFCSAPMLLAWYNAKTGEYVPKAECGRTDKPGWITYAESRGGTITISFNNEKYVFIFKPYP